MPLSRDAPGSCGQPVGANALLAAYIVIACSSRHMHLPLAAKTRNAGWGRGDRYREQDYSAFAVLSAVISAAMASSGLRILPVFRLRSIVVAIMAALVRR